jgi:DNA-binding MarR family transcriptional regulator
MNDINIDRILDNMFSIMFVIHKKILRMNLDGDADNLNRLQMAVMGVLRTTSVTMTELAKTLMMTKPQLTHVVNRLVKLGIVERQPDAMDRRVIHVALTDNGRKTFEDMRQKMKEKIKNRLASLTSEELNQMSTALETLRNIVGKL